MPLEAPKLDHRTFEDIFREALLRIPRYTPEWTDFNESDPGITLLQLFSWLTEMTLFELNQVPERNYIKFLQLLDLELRAAQPAVAHVTFAIPPDSQETAVPPYTRLSAEGSNGEPLVFETEKGLSLVKYPLTHLQVFDGMGFQVVTAANEAQNKPFFPFGWEPQINSALYLGFEAEESEDEESEPKGVMFPQEISLRSFLPLSQRVGQAVNAAEVYKPKQPTVDLVWEYKSKKNDTRWRRLNRFEDSSVGLTREGYITLEGPQDIIPTVEGQVEPACYWIRCRIEKGAYTQKEIPKIDFLRTNTVNAINLTTVEGEIIGRSEGLPTQTFAFESRPIVADTLTLEIVVDGIDEPEKWEQKSDLLSSGPEDSHFVLNPNKGEIQFGDGKNGRIPVAGADIVATKYRYGGGSAGNVGPGAINATLDLVAAEVINERASVGGRNEQSLEELKAEAPRMLRSRNRAVTKDDFASLAKEAGSVAKAIALPLTHPDYPGIDVPGAITVVIVPESDQAAPEPSPDLLKSVSRHLNSYRLVTTELYIRGPRYVSIQVEATVAGAAYASFDDVNRRVIEAINRYLSPLGDPESNGEINESNQQNNSEGWKFGEDFYPTSLYSVIMRVADVEQVIKLSIIKNGRPIEDIRKPILIPKDGLVYGTREHNITVIPLLNKEPDLYGN